MGAIRIAMALLRHVDLCAQWNRVSLLRHRQRALLAETLSDFAARGFRDSRRGAAVSSAPRRSHALQRRAEGALSWRDGGRRVDRDFRPGAVEAGAIFRTSKFIRQFSEYSAGAFLLHGRDRGVHRGSRELGVVGAAKPARHAHRRPPTPQAARRGAERSGSDRYRDQKHSGGQNRAGDRDIALTEQDMTIRPRTPSLFRPRKPVDQGILTDNRKLVDDVNRRGLLRGAVSLGALTMLTGCDVSEIGPVQNALRAVSSWNDGVQNAIFRANHLAPTFSPSQVMKPPRFNAYYPIEDVKPVDGASWMLELAGRIENKRPWRARDLYALPEQEIIIRHVCVEGWDYIGQWSGPNLRDFLRRVGADLTAKYVYFICADDFTESIDMPTALHPQTILATKYAGEIIGDPFGYPLRLRTSTKLGYKNAKWIRAIEVTNEFRETYWSERGFNWYAGI